MFNIFKPKINLNICAHDGITSLYTGVGRIAYDSVRVLCRKNILGIPYRVNVITGKYNNNCLGFQENIREDTRESVRRTGGDLYECFNYSNGDVSYGNIKNWQAVSVSAATILKSISELYPQSVNINICLDTPFAQVPNIMLQMGKNMSKHRTIWIPHSTVKIHKVDSAIQEERDYYNIRAGWEQEVIDLASKNKYVYIGYVGEFMKKHLIKEYSANISKLLDFTNGLDLKNPRFTRRYQEKEVIDILNIYRIPLDKPLIVSFGRLEDYKGFEYTIKVGGMLEKKGVQTVLIAQPYHQADPIISEYKNLFRKYNPHGIFISEYPFDLPHKILQWKNTKILLVPSVAEPFGLVPEEGRLYRRKQLAIVTSKTDGFLEQIDDGVDGFMLNFDDLKLAADRLIKILDLPPSEIEMINQKGYLRAISKYDLEKNISSSIKNFISI